MGLSVGVFRIHWAGRGWYERYRLHQITLKTQLIPGGLFFILIHLQSFYFSGNIFRFQLFLLAIPFSVLKRKAKIQEPNWTTTISNKYYSLLLDVLLLCTERERENVRERERTGGITRSGVKGEIYPKLCLPAWCGKGNWECYYHDRPSICHPTSS